MLLKAKIGVVFSLIQPDKTFSCLTDRFQLIDFESDIIKENFGFLREIL